VTSHAGGSEDALAAELWQLEASLWQPLKRNDAAYVNTILHPGYRETGPDPVRTRAEMLQPAGEFSARLSDVVLVQLAPDKAMIIYRCTPIVPTAEPTLRTSLWVKENGAWLLQLHQARPAPPTSGSP
jgi:hypothetical protein